MKKLKRAVIKEELVLLTGDFKKAIVLSQMIYWSERVKDVDKYIEDEKKRARMAMGSEERMRAEQLEEVSENLLSHGWIYKSAEDLSEETMMGVSKSTMGRYLNELVENGWLDRRKNPKWKGDNTFHYRVNLIKIQKDLHKLGYSLEGYSIDISMFQNENAEFDNDTSKFQNEMDSSKIEQSVSKSNNQFQNETTLPKTTRETTSYTTSYISSSSNSDINLIENELKEKYSNVPFEEVKEELLKDETATINTDKQYKSMLEYRLKNWKPKKNKGENNNRVGKAKKIVKTEMLPEWFDEDENKQLTSHEQEQTKDPEEQEIKKQEIEEMMKRLRS